ncbi:MAG: hypothetical protein WKF96_20315 [Solirubrobacteraceae bacterium]
MHAVFRWAPALLATLPLALAAPAQADKITLGSDLSATPTITDAHGADTAFWPAAIDGAGVEVPEDGQVISVKVKGSAIKERGAGDPATMVHFQSLAPAGANGARQIYLTSAPFYMPVDEPSKVSTFAPENLCVKQGGTVAFNTIGGFQWGGALDAPLDEEHYRNGTPWQIFAAGRSATAWYSKDNGTKNGHTLTPAGGTNATEGYGKIEQGKELLMQVVVATGNDRSEPCGGPRRHADGSLVQTGPAPSYMKVASSGSKPQQPYVTKDRRFTTGVYCGGTANAVCSGTATMLLGTRIIAKANFSIARMKTGKIPMRLGKKSFRRLDRSKTKTLKVTYVLSTAFGDFTTPLTLKR